MFFPIVMAAVIAWTEPSAALERFIGGTPIPSAQDPVSMEFGDGFLLPGSPGLAQEAILRQLHRMAFGLEPDGLEELSAFIDENWPVLDTDTRNLWRELAGRTGMPAPEESASIETLTSLLRYASESGAPAPAVDTGELNALQRYYYVMTLGPEEAQGFMNDECWAVRQAVISHHPNCAFEMLDDPSPAVRLVAAGATGRSDILLELSSTPGPVGHMAIQGVGQLNILEDSLYRSENPAMRVSALIGLLELGWCIPDERLDYLLTDGYVMVRAIASDVSGRQFSMPEEGEPGDLPALVEVPEEVVIVTTEGDFRMELLKDTAPVTCRSFWHLAEIGFYDGIYFHRVLPGFVAQAGCPEGNGYGGPGYVLPPEHNTFPYERGTVGMADSGPGTAGSQFFIMLDSHRRLDCRYTAFGKIDPDQPLDHIEPGTQILEIRPANS